MALACTLALALAACSGSSSSATFPVSSVGGSGAATSTDAPTATPAAASDLLAGALDPLGTAAAFDSTVTVDGKVVTSLKGRSVGSASQLEVTTGGKTVDYVRLPPEAWARQAGGAWVLVDESQAPDSPLAALASPLSVSLATSGSAASAAPGTTALQATYAAAALGLNGDPVPVTIELASNQVTFRYETTSGGHDVVSMTTFQPASPSPAITAPA